MTPRTWKLVAGFLAGFVALSLLQRLPEVVGRVGEAAWAMTETVIRSADASAMIPGDSVADPLLAAAAFAALLLMIRVRRRRSAAAPAVRREAARPPRREESLRGVLRAAAAGGVRGAALARQFGLSVDAVRVAVGREPEPPAGEHGTSFRARQGPAAPGKAVARLPERTSYRASA